MVENKRNVGFVEPYKDKDSEVMEILGSKAEELWHQSLWNQMKDIVMFTGPAAGLWICGPLRILIDTAVVGQRSSLELAALGPGTVLCESVGHVFVFLSVATSNMVATSLAKLDKKEVQHQISILLFVGLACGFFTLFLTKSFGSQALIAFAGPNNAHLVPAANTYIRAIAWPAVLVGYVAQSASLGMKDSWAPLKALGAGTAINGIGDVVLCIYLSYGIAGAAWATMVSQVVAAYMMIEALNKKGYNALAISIPSLSDVSTIVRVAGPLFVALMSKVAFYVVMIYFATSMGTSTVAAHQVMMQVFTLFTIWGEPLSQTAQTFMPELIHGVNKSLKKARMLLKSLVTIGAALGLVLGVIGILVPWLFPTVFTHDQHVTEKMQRVLVPYFIAIVVTPCTHSFEGTLVGGSDVRFLSISMTGCFSTCGIVLLILSNRGWGLPGCWWALAGFQWARFCVALKRLLSPNGVLFSQSQALSVYEPVKTEPT